MKHWLRLSALEARAELASGKLRGDALRDRLLKIPFNERDAWLDELLGFEWPPPDIPDLPRGAVPYLPCSVDEILTMVRDAPVGPTDEFVDLGSGLGRVVVLVHLLTGARARGVEIQEPLVRLALEHCAGFSLSGVSFLRANVAETELDGSIFFLYAPCNGPMLAAVLRRLEAVARRRAIVVGAVGLEFRGVPWLRPRASSIASLTLYDSYEP